MAMESEDILKDKEGSDSLTAERRDRGSQRLQNAAKNHTIVIWFTL
jgi:hypothetical protein